MPTIRLLVIAASQRQGSYNRQLAAAHARCAGAEAFDAQGGLKDARSAGAVQGVVDALLALAAALQRPG